MTKIRILLACVVLYAFLEIYCGNSHHSRSHPYIVNFTVYNPYFHPVAFDSVSSPFDEYCAFMELTFGNERIPYKGPLFSRLVQVNLFGAQSTLIGLGPFQSRTVQFNLGRYYDLNRPGIYTIQFKQVHTIYDALPSSLQEMSPAESINLPSLTGKLASTFGSWMRVLGSSNSINITITEDDIATMDSS